MEIQKIDRTKKEINLLKKLIKKICTNTNTISILKRDNKLYCTDSNTWLEIPDCILSDGLYTYTSILNYINNSNNIVPVPFPEDSNAYLSHSTDQFKDIRNNDNIYNYVIKNFEKYHNVISGSLKNKRTYSSEKMSRGFFIDSKKFYML